MTHATTSTQGSQAARRNAAPKARRASATHAHGAAIPSAGASMGARTGAAVAPRLAEHSRMLWGVCYRMTGSAADADDLVQETFVRAMERPPARTDEPLAPWLLRVAVNLGRDALRRRKRRSYVGPWLPAPIEVDEVASFEIEGEAGTEGRYDLMESVSYAFLLALEVLTPNQRAVLLLRDVLDRSVRETADALAMSEANVKVVHHRARHALAPYDATRATTRPTAEVVKSTTDAIQRLLMALGAGDEAAIASVFADGVEAWSDGGGEFMAARRIVTGAAPVAKMYRGLTRKTTPVERVALRVLNGVPWIVCERSPHEGEAPRFILGCDVDAAGRISRIYSVLATSKLTRVPRLEA